MERRKEPRIKFKQEVTVTVLGDPDSAPFPATTVEMSGSGMRILCTQPVRYQAVVKVQTGDILLLGEVIRVNGNELALKLRHSLDSLGDLRRLNQALRWEGQKDEALIQE